MGIVAVQRRQIFLSFFPLFLPAWNSMAGYSWKWLVCTCVYVCGWMVNGGIASVHLAA